MRKPEQVRQSVMEKLKKHGQSVVLLILAVSALHAISKPLHNVADKTDQAAQPAGRRSRLALARSHLSRHPRKLGCTPLMAYRHVR
jgi:hypothetical protein